MKIFLIRPPTIRVAGKIISEHKTDIIGHQPASTPPAIA